MLNVTTGGIGYPSAVLIRGIYDTETGRSISGPGRVTRYLAVDRSLNQEPIYTEDAKLWVESADMEYPHVKASPRIGIDYAKECREWLWRYTIDPKATKKHPYDTDDR